MCNMRARHFTVTYQLKERIQYRCRVVDTDTKREDELDIVKGNS